MLHLDRLFNVAEAVADPSEGLVVLVETAGGEKVGIKVDELLGQQQVVIKSLQENFHPVTGTSGATILGNGKVALILDIEQLAKMIERQSNLLDEDGETPIHAETTRPPSAAHGGAEHVQHALSA